MDKWRSISVFFLILHILACLWVHPACAEAVRDYGLSLGAGYRIDDIDWSIAGYSDGEYINILSELTWSDIEIYQVNMNAHICVGSQDPARAGAYFRGHVGYGWIVQGENQDSDYDGNDRTLEWSRSNNNSDDGDVKDVSLGIGLCFKRMGDRLALKPLVGYSYHEQNLTATDGFQTIPPLGPFPGLDSTYEIQWKGPWIGADLDFAVNRNFLLAILLEYHWAHYEAEADWNLRTDLAHPKSFEHTADGNGVVLSFSLGYSFSKNWSADLQMDYQKWDTENGTHRVFFADGSTGTTRLNGVNLESFAYMLRVTYRFVPSFSDGQ